MPLGAVLDDRFAQLCGIELPFSFDVKHAIDVNIRHGDFDFLFCPVMFTGYAPSKDKALTLDQQLLPYAGLNASVTYGQWAGLVFAKISPTWLDLDSEDENVRVNAEAFLKQQIEWASYLSIKHCVLPTPDGNSCANYARCVNQILQGLKNTESAMKLLLRIPVGMSDDDYRPLSNALVDSWETWNSFRMLCDHHSQLAVALDIKRVLPPENSLKRWFGEPVTAAILDTEIFLTKARDNTSYLPKRHQKLIADLFHLDTRIVISEIKVPTSAQSAAGSKSQSLLAYRNQVSNIYKQRDPVSEQERSDFYTWDILQPPLRAKARKYILHSESACVVKLYNVARLAPSQQAFTFTHPKWFDKESNERYKKLQFEIPKDTGSAMVHGFAGYFNMTLYKDVRLATEPSTKMRDLISWYPMFFPLRMPIRVDCGSILEVHFWRCVDSRKVWYEWCVTSPSSSPIHNCNGRSCWMDL